MRVPASMRRAGTLAIAGALFLVLVGATLQGVATALERHAFPHPGRLVDLGDHQLHIHCTGDGSPTVVLEAGAGAISASWGGIQPRLSRLTRVCSYDRAGLGWSEAGDRPFAPESVSDSLRMLLDRAGERPPVIAVGRGLGAAFARSFAIRHPEWVSSLIVIDPVDESTGLGDDPLARINVGTPWLARLGIRRLMRSAEPAVSSLPAPSAGAMRTFLYRPDHLTHAAAEIARWREIVRLAAVQVPVAPVVEASGDADGVEAAIEAAIARSRASGSA